MQRLIQDLLAFSRVATKGKELLKTSSESALKTALSNLRGAIEEKGALVTHDVPAYAVVAGHPVATWDVEGPVGGAGAEVPVEVALGERLVGAANHLLDRLGPGRPPGSDPGA